MAPPLPASAGIFINDLPRHLAGRPSPAARAPANGSLLVTRAELRTAIEASNGGDYAEMLRNAPAADKGTTIARALSSAIGAVSQPEYRDGKPTGKFLTGIDGAKALLDGFGDKQRVRTIRLDPQKLGALHAALPPLARERLGNDMASAAKISSDRDILGPALGQSEAKRLRSEGYGR